MSAPLGVAVAPALAAPAAAAARAAARAASSGSGGDITPGVLGFLIVAALGVTLFFLLRSMNKHLRRVSAARDAGRELGQDVPDSSAAPRSGAPGPGAD
jgi:hypothetical protein